MTQTYFMREIKFRAWDNKEKKWELGYDLPNLGGFSMYGETILLGEYSHMIDKYLFHRDGYAPSDLKLMQYTGLKDKNGKEIYEGDIIDYEDKHGLTQDFTEEVVWIDDKYNCGWGTESSDQVWAEVARQSEVIGNIYEHPELNNN